MFDLVPFAGSWWKVTNRNRQSQVVSQLLQGNFPQSAPAAVAATAISRDQQLTRVPVQGLPQAVPPPPNRLDREGRRIVVAPDTDPPHVK
jgi:precorrin-4 methylase